MLCPDKAFKGDVSGRHVVEWYQQLFRDSITFASILASVMFSVLVLDPEATKFSRSIDCECDVRTWGATGSIMFVLPVLECQACSLVLKFHGRYFARQHDSKTFWMRLSFALISLLFQEFLLTGTLFFCLVVKSFVPAVGWSAFGVTSFLVLLSLVIWLTGFCIECRSQYNMRNGDPWVTAKQAAEDEDEADREMEEEARTRSHGTR